MFERGRGRKRERKREREQKERKEERERETNFEGGESGAVRELSWNVLYH